MKTPWPGLGLLAIYLLTVLKWLPKYMESRPAYNLRSVIALYNAVQILACSYVVYQSLTLAWLRHYSLLCQPMEYGEQGTEFAWKVCYTYFFIKLADLFDTIFFVLRKKQNQVSFLHVYHHCGMVAVAWSMVKWLPGGHTSFLVVVNSFVHIVMYSYYLLTVWDDAYKQSLWWKKHVTQLQILQFTILFLHFSALALVDECAFPRQPAYILIPQNLFMVILFSDFYYRAYIKSSSIAKNK
ncbi:elongation of very long chain fatty acids protein isoform X2 [Bicyclus anynana]|nr:elongation of very long chain fatty acids protein isoform X2 [Bicyclus anynana]